ncbi:hypothetical protein EVAR_96637_1 [Eumeta japonica]|uniref:Uncharacterized protein n=1 Tax=Eumeta variegata TaxID=151549 RepID=A0A4C1WUQ9_EUMVA|nr:hypothetical protein EVAR_96637_1 [Eumeta japonica]
MRRSLYTHEKPAPRPHCELRSAMLRAASSTPLPQNKYIQKYFKQEKSDNSFTIIIEVLSFDLHTNVTVKVCDFFIMKVCLQIKEDNKLMSRRPPPAARLRRQHFATRVRQA